MERRTSSRTYRELSCQVKLRIPHPNCLAKLPPTSRRHRTVRRISASKAGIYRHPKERPRKASMSATDGHDSGQKPPRTREMHIGRSLMGAPDRHSDDPGLSVKVRDPATAQGSEQQWTEEKLSTSEKSSLPLDTAEEKNIIEAEIKLADGDLEQQKSKTSLAGMMVNFPDGGLGAWLPF